MDPGRRENGIGGGDIARARLACLLEAPQLGLGNRRDGLAAGQGEIVVVEASFHPKPRSWNRRAGKEGEDSEEAVKRKRGNEGLSERKLIW